MSGLWVNGVVSARDEKPYVQLSDDERIIAQLSIAQARNFAMDILQMAARTEADAMIHKFFLKTEIPSISNSIMIQFRDFRAELDQEEIEREQQDPDKPPDDEE